MLLPPLNDAYENNMGSRFHCTILLLYILCWIPDTYLGEGGNARLVK